MNADSAALLQKASSLLEQSAIPAVADLDEARRLLRLVLAQQAATQTPRPTGPFKYEYIPDKLDLRGEANYRVADANDDRIATCFVEDHAKFIVANLNGEMQ